MKKLNETKLKTIDFSQDEILSKASLKAIRGGSVPCSCNGMDVGPTPTIEDCLRKCDRILGQIER